ncbi:NAD-dependent epimerase/dehydratase family protein, partial [Thermodesulfovibrionales bacterium]|nr:NAD-dependent epimerase/dehydratase family protein [Thermodesulfovibrionales bacterium]
MEQLQKKNPKSIFVPRSKDYDLREKEAIVRLYEDSKPDIVIHLAAVVGGIGANLAHPGQFFYDNAIMGIQLIEYARRLG